MQYSAVGSAIQCYAALYRAVQCYTVLRSNVRCCTVLTVRYAAVHSAVRTVHLLVLFLEHSLAVHESLVPTLPTHSQSKLRSILGASNTQSIGLEGDSVQGVASSRGKGR